MKLIIIATLMIFSLMACNPPKIAPQERCTISFTFNKCRCHLYDLMTQQRVSEAYDKEPEQCDDVTGFSAESWSKKITPWAKKSVQYYKDECSKKDDQESNLKDIKDAHFRVGPL